MRRWEALTNLTRQTAAIALAFTSSSLIAADPCRVTLPLLCYCTFVTIHSASANTLLFPRDARRLLRQKISNLAFVFAGVLIWVVPSSDTISA
jgi:hypothetical protein